MELSNTLDLSLNRKLHHRLKETNVTHRELALHLGISSASVNERLNKNRRIDSISFIKAVCELTCTPISHFIELEQKAAGQYEKDEHRFYLANSISMTEFLIFIVRKHKIRRIVIQKELGLSHSVVSWRLSGKNEIDSLRFVKTISRISGVPLSIFINNNWDRIKNKTA